MFRCLIDDVRGLLERAHVILEFISTEAGLGQKEGMFNGVRETGGHKAREERERSQSVDRFHLSQYREVV